MIAMKEHQAPAATNVQRPEHIPTLVETATIYGTQTLMELPAPTVIRPHFSVRREILEHMSPVAKMTAELCILHGSWELIES